jgi:hypothetical protein
LRLRERGTLQDIPVRAFVSILFTLMAVSMPVHADERVKEVERFMEEYLRTWNAGDTATITTQIYRFDGPNAFATQVGLQSEFDRLKANGYSHSKQLNFIPMNPTTKLACSSFME